ncbi:SemiSWEET transporter [Lactococcus lactis]|uniref:SemiSWEET transporter n=1 Tax=Lactococcus lactis TaxID=1358 RepID=UPI00071E4E6A|nr:SemiSWEET transporter [Lactococcus lactis]MDU0398169.1 Sugar transporter SemiSWEET [Lactococcus lactis]
MIIIGLIAGGLTSVSFIPQAIKTIRTQNTSGISLTTYMLFTIGVALWVIYGYFTEDFAILLTNLITVIPSLTISIMKVRNSFK